MAPDSILVKLPGLFSVKVPAESVWDALETIVSGVTVALVAFWLARRRFRTERWHERRQEVYGTLNRQLYEIDRSKRPLADDERRAEESRPRLLSPPEREEHHRRSRLAYGKLGEVFEEHKYLLSSRAVRIIEEYFQTMDSEEVIDTSRPDNVEYYIAHKAFREFRERLLVDVGTELGLGWRVRLWGRSIARWWYRAKQWPHSMRFGLRAWWEDQKLRFGPQLTQADVRTPPRYPHFKTVEEMKRLGWGKARIQRRLREQLAADPPPWDRLPGPPPPSNP